jgi:integrase
MATPKKTPQGTYRVLVCVKDHRDSKTFPTKREAQTWAARRETELRLISNGQVNKLKTAADAMLRYSEEVSPTHKGERWEVVRLTKMAREFPHVFLDKLMDDHVIEWRDKRLTEVGPASVLREMKLLSSVFEQCRRDWKWIEVNPCKDVRKPSAPAHRSRLINRQEIKTMLRELGYPRRDLPRHAVAHAFLLALRTGMRQGELAAIRWEDVKAKELRLHDTKNGSVRDVPLPAKAVRIIGRMRGYDQYSMFAIGSASIDTHFRNAKTRAGLTGFTWHDSRHTAATWIGRSSKLNVLEMCAMFGWSDPKMAMVYFNPSASDLADKL